MILRNVKRANEFIGSNGGKFWSLNLEVCGHIEYRRFKPKRKIKCHLCTETPEFFRRRFDYETKTKT